MRCKNKITNAKKLIIKADDEVNNQSFAMQEEKHYGWSKYE